MILFRKRSDKPDRSFDSTEQPFQRGLAIFVVGEEATRGVHRRQFENATAWIAALQPHAGICVPLAILGPTFSGSLPSLAKLMANHDVQRFLNYTSVFHMPDRQVRVYSGSISGKEAAEAFGGTTVSDPNLIGWNIHFHSFVESDDRVLNDYCDYLRKGGFTLTELRSFQKTKLRTESAGSKNLRERKKSRKTLHWARPPFKANEPMTQFPVPERCDCSIHAIFLLCGRRIKHNPFFLRQTQRNPIVSARVCLLI